MSNSLRPIQFKTQRYISVCHWETYLLSMMVTGVVKASSVAYSNFSTYIPIAGIHH